ncbi:MAG: hypothetical protein AB3N33_04770 [Puniceicoccaceae bacterium]
MLTAQKRDDISEDDPLFDLEEFVVNYHPENFAPAFRVKSPQFTYYEQPKLERGDLVLALEFMDRYRESLIPGQYKWACMLHFPVIDGEERPHLKWLCLYFYNDRMFGYDPGAEYESDRRFFVPISYEDRMKSDVLFQFASSYVEEVFPERTEEIIIYEDMVLDDEEEYGYTEETWETIDIPAGRIDGVLQSQKGKRPEELVRLIYRYGEDPNPGRDAESAFGKAEDVGKEKFSWSDYWDELTGYYDNIEVASEMLAPRWTQKLYFHYTKDLWILPDYHGKASALAFNIGTRVYVYSPKYGVWKTDATIHDLSDREAFADKMKYPGLKEIDRVEFIPLAENQAAEN